MQSTKRIRIIIGRYPDFKLPNTQTVSDWFDTSREWIHTLVSGQLLPIGAPEECFALLNGSREGRQLCLSEPKTLELVSWELSQRMSKYPQINHWSVSIGDNTDWCQCNQCKTKTPSNTIIEFVNRIAQANPSKTLYTLAYFATQPPATIRPDKNIRVILTTIRVPKDIPIEIGTRGEAIDFRKDLSGWLKVTKPENIVIWDYTCNFRHLLMPYPVMYPMLENIAWYSSMGIKNFIVQNNSEKGHEFSEIKSEMIASMMENPTQDINLLVNRTGRAYYGNSWQYVKQYIDLLHDNQKTGKWLINWANPQEFTGSFLSPSNLRIYLSILAKARPIMAVEPEYAKRVRAVELQALYTLIELGVSTPEDVVRFKAYCTEIGDFSINEHNLSWQQYLIDRNIT